MSRAVGKPREGRRVFRELERRAGMSYYGFLGSDHRGQIKPRRIKKGDRPAHHQFFLTSENCQKKRATWFKLSTLYAGLALSVSLGVYRHHRLAKQISKQLGRRRSRYFRRRCHFGWKSGGADGDAKAAKAEEFRGEKALISCPIANAKMLPPAYLALARAAGRAYDVSPWWLLSHMLQESRYKERARSHALALGPMQIIPERAESLPRISVFRKVGFWMKSFLCPESLCARPPGISRN